MDDPLDEPDRDRMDRYVKGAYDTIVGEIGDLISIKDRHTIANALEAACTELASDMY